MDASTIATIAGTTVSLLVPYLKVLGEELAKKTGEEIGTKASQVAWDKAKQIYLAVKSKFTQNPETSKVMSELEKSPADEDTQAALRFHLKEMMNSDESFALDLVTMLKEASEVGVDSVFQTKIYGNVQKLVQIGNLFGDAKF